MQVKSSTNEALAQQLMDAFVPIFKGSQAEIMAATADLDLTLSQCRILLELERDGEDLPVHDLSERISLSLPATGRAIDALYRSGVLTRREDDIDRRVRRIGLTERGWEVVARITQVRKQGAERMIAALNKSERTELGGAVAIIAALVSRHLPTMYGNTSTTESLPANRESDSQLATLSN